MDQIKPIALQTKTKVENQVEQSMNKRIKEKLKMHSPDFYDATENRVVVAQEHSLKELFRDARAEGGSIATFIGSLGVFLSTMLTLASAETFKDKFGVPASSWQAIFIMVAISSFTVGIWQLVVLGVRLWRKRFLSEDIVRSKFFSDTNRLSGRINPRLQDGDRQGRR